MSLINDELLKRRPMRVAVVLLICATGLFTFAEPSSGQAAAETPAAAIDTQNEIERLKSQLAAQQEQINELRKRLEAQQRLLEKAFPDPIAAPTSERTAYNPTNFAAIPFNNTVLGHRRQTLSSGAYSRLGVRLRLRLAFADVQKGRWEILAGQAWSLLTPSRRGISPLTSELFLTQDLDPNIQSGLVWARTPQLRVIYHPNDSVAMGVSFESGDTYAGGSAGAGTITLPTALAPDYFGQVDLSTGNGNSVPNPNTDLIAKIAFDPKVSGRSMHFEIAGLLNRFAFFNPLNNQRFSVIGGGVAINAGIEVVRKLTIFTNNFYSDGGGNFIFGEAPDLIIRGNGAPSLVRAGATVGGLECQVTPKWKLWAYYGGTYIDRNVTIDPSTGQPVGYGYPNSPNSQNRSIQEVTAGFSRVFWQNPNYGALKFKGMEET